MTYREYLEGYGVVEKVIMMVNIIRKYHHYLENLSIVDQRKAINEILDTEMPMRKESEVE